MFFNALTFFTRIPAPASIQFNGALLQDAARYFPLVGMIVGSLVWAALAVCLFFLPLNVAVIFAMVVSILITGAFHEDGLADCADAFGGGYSKESILTIMHDSRLGTYGVIALCASLGLKFCLLSYLAEPAVTASTQLLPSLLVMFVVANGVSRWLAVVLMYFTPYVAFGEQSKSKPIASNISGQSIVIASLITGLLWLVSGICLSWLAFTALPIVLAIVYILARRYFVKHIGGVNGDCLGAVQQLSEAAVYSVLVALVHLDHM